MKLLALALIFPLATTAPAQELFQDEAAGAKEAGHLGLSVFRPEVADAYELIELAATLTNDRVTVVVRESDQPSQRLSRDRFVVVGDAVLINDDERGRGEALELLRTLDDVFVNEQGGDLPVEDGWETAEYRPRYLGLQRTYELLASMAPAVELQPVAETRMLVISGEHDDVQWAVEAMQRVDVPSPQVSLSCLFVSSRASAEDGGGAMPPEVAAALAELVPGREFGVLGSGFVRASLGDGTQLRMEGRLAAGHKFELQALPQAFDDAQRVLSLTRCHFELASERTQNTASGSGQVQESFAGYTTESSFQTDLALREGEYTVVGGSGADPVFVVLRFVVQ